MSYNFSNITTIEECNQLTRMAQRDKAAAENKKRNLEFEAEQKLDSKEDRSYALQQAQREMVNLLDDLSRETAGSNPWKKLESQRKILEGRIMMMELNQSMTMGVSAIEREYEISLLSAQMAAADALITAAEAHKQTLPA